jgi:phosphatidylethanolamine/phosphatidyl-N-methylethanolamine N-methyltransferase
MSNRAEKFYNKFSSLYPLADIFLKPQKRKLFHEVNSVPFGQLLEIGVGNGSHFHLYRTHKIIGIDTSLSMLKYAGKRKSGNIELYLMNGEALSFRDQTFDYVVLSHVIAVVDNPEKLLEEIYRVLKPDGKIFILNHFTPLNWLRHIDRFARVFSKMFHFESLFYINSLPAIKKFTLLKEIRFGPFSYFKLLIYCIYCYIIASLLAGLFIYLWYRTEKTVINEILISIISFEKYAALRTAVANSFPLNKHIIYSLPEGLWVFCITLTSKFFFVKTGPYEINLVFAPIVFATGLELLQLFHLTNGRFDIWDIGASILFWTMARYLIKYESPRQNILRPFALQSFICLLSYLIVYFAHVWK